MEVDWKAAYDDLHKQFMQETLRTSEYYQLTDKMMRRLYDRGCVPENWSKACDDCKWMVEAKALMDKPINAGSICVCGYSLGVHMVCERAGSWSDFPGCCTAFQPRTVAATKAA